MYLVYSKGSVPIFRFKRHKTENWVEKKERLSPPHFYCFRLLNLMMELQKFREIGLFPILIPGSCE